MRIIFLPFLYTTRSVMFSTLHPSKKYMFANTDAKKLNALGTPDADSVPWSPTVFL